MNVSLTPEQEQYVHQMVASGVYQSPNEVVGEGLRLLQERAELQHAKLDELRREIAKGIEQAEQGLLAPLQARQTLENLRLKRTSS